MKNLNINLDGRAAASAVLLICLFLAGVVVAEDGTNYSVGALNSAAIEARYKNVEYGYEKTLAAMNIVIQYFSNRSDATVLSEIRDNFTTLFDSLKQYVDANDPSGFGMKVAEMHRTAAQFKAETARIAAPGEMGDLKKLIEERIEIKEKETRMQDIREQYAKNVKNVYTIACGINIARMKQFVARVRAQNVSVVDLEDIEKKIEDLCGNISEMKNVSELGARVASLNKEFKTIRDAAHAKAIEVNEKALDRAIAVIEKLQNRGINVSNASEKLKAVEALREEVREACKNLNDTASIGLCKDKITAMKNETDNLGDQIRAVIRERTGKAAVGSAGGRGR